jgi:hypothetical protein
MGSDPLQNLVAAGKLKAEPSDARELAKLLTAARTRLRDARRSELGWESRFDLAYNAAYGFSLAALRRSGYRSENRYIVFQCLPHTLGVATGDWRVLALAHERRNKLEYSGEYEVDERLVGEMIRVTELILERLTARP